MPIDNTLGRHPNFIDPSLKPGVWNCPTCNAQNVGPLDSGCATCGAGTERERETSRLQQQDGVPSGKDLFPFLVPLGLQPEESVIKLPALSDRARLTVARALAFYSERANPAPSELTRMQCLGWAKVLVEEE